MTIYEILIGLLWMLLAVAAYRLGLADGVSISRKGMLVGKDRPAKEDSLLKRIEAFYGRKGKDESEL